MFKSKQFIMSLLLFFVFFFSCCFASFSYAASSATLPAHLEKISVEAFMNTTFVEVVIPESVIQIQSRAFAQCEQLNAVHFPNHNIDIAEDAFDGSDVCFYAYAGTNVVNYANKHSIPVVLLNDSLRILSIETDLNIHYVNSSSTWVVKTANVEDCAYFQYVLYCDGELVTKSSYTDKSYFSYTFANSGLYTLNVICFDGSGSIVESTSSPVTVLPRVATLVSVQDDGQAIVENDVIRWTYEIIDLSESTTFDYVVTYNEEVIVQASETKETSYAYPLAIPGTYVMEVTCRDNGTVTTATSEPVVIYTQEEAFPSAPQMIATSELDMPSAHQDDAPFYTVGSVSLAWNAVDAAKYYGLELQKISNEGWTIGDAWETVYIDEAVEEEKYQISADLFADVTESTLYRVALYSVGARRGESSYWYFRVAPEVTDDNILVASASIAYWDQVGKQANNRFFEVQSELPWTATVDVEWIELSVDKTGIMVKMLDSIYNHDLHVGTVTLSNGVNTAKIVVTRDSSSNNVTLDNHNWSKNESSPSQIPAGGTYLEVTHSYEKLALTIYEKQSSGTWSQVYFTFVDDRIALQDTVGGYTFQGDTDYRFTFTGHITEDRWQSAEVAAEIPETHYYVHMTSTGHAITVEEKKNQSMTIIDSLYLSVDATNVWSVSEDADWLTAYINERGYRDIDINAQPNYTGADRTAEVVFTCRSAQVILTLTQPDMTPKLIFPENLSQSQSSPTLITGNNFAYKYIGNTLQFYYLQNGEFVKDEINYERISPFGISSDTWLAEYFEPNLLYKLEISDDAGNATNYYVKFEAASSAYVTVEDLGLYEWETSGAASSTTVTLAASGTWKASSDASWLTVSSTSGSKTSGKKLTVSVTENTTGAPRTGAITFTRGTADTAYVKVTQDVTSSYLAIYDKEKETITEDTMTTDVLDGDEQTYDIYVYTDDAWELSESASWISTKITDNRIRLTISENGVGGSLRKANITVTTASAQCTLTVQQTAKLAAPVVNWNVSTDYKNPSVLIKEDHTFSWTTVAGAAYYNVVFCSVGPDGSTYYGSKIVENGSSSYTYTLPENWQQVYADDYCYLEVEAVDAYGHEEPSEQFSFYITDNPKAFLNGSSAPKWLNAVDVPVSKKFTVSSVGSWTAAARQSWISLDVTSGVSGDVLTVSLADNTGAARSGQVSVVCGGYETILNITQCGMLEEYPSLLTPVLSDDYISPTVMPADTTSLTVTWEQAPQAGFYWAFIETMKPDSGWTTIADSDYMYKGTGTYTFNNLSLTAGQIYRLHFVRSCERHGATGKSYYILADGAESFVLADGENTQLFDAFGDEDVETYRITAGGVWTAEASDDWIMVASHSVDQKELDENGYSSTRYNTYLGRPDTKLVISLLANPNKAVRKGTVTLRSGSASMVIDVSQDPYYDAARIVSPVLGETSSSANEIKPGSLALSWSSAEGGTGIYRVTLDAYDEEERDYFEVYDKKNITSCSLSIPSSVFQENTKYFLCLYTEVEGLDYDVKETYYFRTGSKDALVINGDANWDFACVNGYVNVSMSASGGTGGYQYAYELLCNGEQQQITAWGNWNEYRFALNKPGNYQIRFYVKDNAGNTTNALSNTHNVSTIEENIGGASTTNSSWKAPQGGGFTNIIINTDGNWNILSVPTWLHLSSTTGTGRTMVSIEADENPGANRETRIIISKGNSDEILYVKQEGKSVGITAPTFTYPNTDNATLPFSDITFAWESQGAMSYVFSLRDITTDILMISHESVGTNTTYTVPAEAFVSGHKYRVAVGASDQSNPMVSDEKKWRELEFVIAKQSDATRLSGKVISADGNNLSDVLVAVEAEDYVIAYTLTNSFGEWSISGLYPGATYTVSFDKVGYYFANEKTIQASSSSVVVDTLSSLNAYADEVQVLSTNTDELNFGSGEEMAELYINAPGSWQIQSNVDWLSFSTESGIGSSWIVVTAADNSVATEGSDDRAAMITITEIISTARSINRGQLVSSSRGSTSVRVSQGSRNSKATSTEDVFDGNKYTGAPIIGNCSFTGNLTIDKDMDLQDGYLYVDGDVTIKSKIDFGYSGSLHVSGDIKVKGNGILDMSSGGELHVDGDFTFDSSKSHKDYLTDGDIKVGGDVEIKQKFYAGKDNRFTIIDNGKKHEINMWNKWIQPDQYFGIFIAEPSISKLIIKESFDATDSIWNYSDYETYHSGYAFELTRTTGNSISDDINARIQAGMLQLISKHGKTKTYLGMDIIQCEETDYFSYLSADGEIKEYELELNMTKFFINSAGLGTGVYRDDDGHYVSFSIVSAYSEIDTLMKEFGEFSKKMVLDAVSDEIGGVAKDWAFSRVLDILPLDGTTKEITKAMKDNTKDLAELYSILEK